MSDITPLRSPLPAKWHLKPLGKICSKIGSGATPRGGSASYLSSGITFIRSQNVLDHAFTRKGLVFINDEAAKKLAGVSVQPRDVLLNITGDGDTIARCCVVPEDILPARVNQHVVIIRPGDELIPEFLQRYLSHPTIREYMLSHNSGGSRRALTKGQIENFEIVVPPIKIQSAITEVLGALDDKIVVNNQLAQTSFDIADARFAQLGIHTTNVESVGDLIELKYGKALPASDRVDGKFPVYGSGGVTGTNDIPLVEGPGVVVGRKGTVGAVYWSGKSFFPIDTTFYVELRGNYLSMEFAFYMLKHLGLEGMNSDSAVPGLNRSNALALQVKVPGESELRRFNEEVRPLFALRESLSGQSASLAELRDTLLPRLISGEIRVRDAEKVVEDVT